MKVLILTSHNGGGHDAVAKAIAQELISRGDTCLIRDCMRFISTDASRIAANGHAFVYRHCPELFGRGYEYAETHDTFRPGSLQRQLLDRGGRSLCAYAARENVDVIVCTHVFAGIMASTWGGGTCLVETDYTCTPGAEQARVDWHLIPHEALRSELVKKGVNADRILVSGIPVRQEIRRCLSREQARAAAGIPVGEPHVLLMGGSMGCGPIPQILDALLQQLPAEVRITTVCGSNEALLSQLQKRYADVPQIRLLGHTEDISTMMDGADVLVTKPGGITVTEAAVKRLPPVLFNAVSGCEAHNLRFFLSRGAALTGDTPEELAACCGALIRNAERRRSVQSGLAQIALANDPYALCCAVHDAGTRARTQYSKEAAQ